MASITVRVVGSDGRPRSNERVSVYVQQLLASGMKEAVYTDSDGEADFNVDIDAGGKISIYVNGNEKVGLGSVKSEYRITI